MRHCLQSNNEPAEAETADGMILLSWANDYPALAIDHQSRHSAERDNS